MKQLTTQELLLLNNLMYMNRVDPMCEIVDYGPGTTVGEIVNRMRSMDLDPTKDYGSYITGEDWNHMLNAIANDPQLMSVQIVAHHTDYAAGGGGGVSTVFADPSTGEAVVVFRGTAAQEWKDDFLGGTATGTADGVSTVQQQNALDWYQSLDLDAYSSVTVTGHSKGGNKAKYITVRDDSVTRCVSFDGQGFSDEFIQTYSAEIAQNQGKISNHNVDYDYVNLVLNDIGSETFYKGYDLGEGGFLENHCPNTFFSFDESGNIIMTETERPAEMAALDQYLNSMIRSMPESQQQDVLELIGDIAQNQLGNGTDGESVMEQLLSVRNADELITVIAFTVVYEYTHPEFSGQIASLLNQFGWKKASIATFAGLEGLNALITAALGGSAVAFRTLPGWIQKLIELWSPNENISNYLNGNDLRVNSTITGAANLSVSDTALQEAAEMLGNSAARIQMISEELRGISYQFTGLLELLLKATVVLRANSLAAKGARCAGLAEKLGEIAACYVSAEQTVMQRF